MAMKCASGFVGADGVGDPLEKIVRQNVRLGRAAGLARYDEQGLAEIEVGFERLDLRRHGRIENAQARPAAFVSERRRQHFGAEAGAAHAEEHGILKSVALDLLREGGVARDARRRRRCPASQASDPRRHSVHSDLSRCQSFRILPCSRHSSAISSTFFSSWWPRASFCSSMLLVEDFSSLLGDSGEELVGGVGE